LNFIVACSTVMLVSIGILSIHPVKTTAPSIIVSQLTTMMNGWYLFIVVFSLIILVLVFTFGACIDWIKKDGMISFWAWQPFNRAGLTSHWIRAISTNVSLKKDEAYAFNKEIIKMQLSMPVSLKDNPIAMKIRLLFILKKN
jgi:hypothetical protein